MLKRNLIVLAGIIELSTVTLHICQMTIHYAVRIFVTHCVLIGCKGTRHIVDTTVALTQLECGAGTQLLILGR